MYLFLLNIFKVSLITTYKKYCHHKVTASNKNKNCDSPPQSEYIFKKEFKLRQSEENKGVGTHDRLKQEL